MNIQEQKQKKLNMFYPVKSTDTTDQVKAIDLTKRTVQFVANTYYWLDSDLDILIDGAAKKSISDRGAASNASAKIKHLADHKMSTDKMVGKPIVTEETNIDGKTVIYFESEIFQTPAGDEHLIKYQSGGYDNHSIGFRYKDLEFAEKESDNSDAKAYWDEYYPQILNPEKADKYGYFWVVKEIELYEASVVTFGSNSMTGVVGFKSKDKQEVLFDLFSRMNSLETQLKTGQINKDSIKSIELQILQIKQIMSDIINQEPPVKDTKKPSVKGTNDIDYDFLLKNIN